MRERVESVARDLAGGGLQAERGKAQLLHTRREVERGWLALAGMLQRDGMSDLAEDVRRHVQRMPSVRTDREEIAHRLHARIRDNPARADADMADERWTTIESATRRTLDVNSMIGQRLRLARIGSRLSLADLESKLDNRVTAQALGKYERDELMPSSQALMSLARALEVSEEYLLGEQDPALDGVEFRSKPDMSAKEKARVEVHMLQLLERCRTVEEILGVAVEWVEPQELASHLERLCYRALVEGAISDAKAAELIGIPARELNRRLDGQERVGASLDASTTVRIER
jgi:transcriptional regulator with XRE-family HTH domain